MPSDEDYYQERAKSLVDATVTGVRDVGKYDIILELDDGRELRVYDAKWSIWEGDDPWDGDDAE